MGRLVADAGKRDWEELTAEYGAMLMEGLSVRSPELVEGMGTRGKHVNAQGAAPAECLTVGGDGFPEESSVERGQGLPVVGWSSAPSSRKPGRDCGR
jgi:hypothetical protein